MSANIHHSLCVSISPSLPNSIEQLIVTGNMQSALQTLSNLNLTIPYQIGTVIITTL